jgi:hypothetical protein
MADYKENAAFAPANGSQPSDVTEPGCDNVFSDSYDQAPLHKDRKAFGGKVGGPVEAKLSKGEDGSWGKQGYMVQPLPGGFAYPQSLTMQRREDFELNEKDNFDPTQALTPRIKKSDTSS